MGLYGVATWVPVAVAHKEWHPVSLQQLFLLWAVATSAMTQWSYQWLCGALRRCRVVSSNYVRSFGELTRTRASHHCSDVHCARVVITAWSCLVPSEKEAQWWCQAEICHYYLFLCAFFSHGDSIWWHYFLLAVLLNIHPWLINPSTPYVVSGLRWLRLRKSIRISCFFSSGPQT